MLLFLAGLLAGIAVTVAAAVAILRWQPERTETPRYFAVGADRLHDSTVNHNAPPSDWQPIFRPNNN
jgi:hypothetical protein